MDTPLNTSGVPAVLAVSAAPDASVREPDELPLPVSVAPEFTVTFDVSEPPRLNTPALTTVGPV